MSIAYEEQITARGSMVLWEDRSGLASCDICVSVSHPSTDSENKKSPTSSSVLNDGSQADLVAINSVDRNIINQIHH